MSFAILYVRGSEKSSLLTPLPLTAAFRAPSALVVAHAADARPAHPLLTPARRNPCGPPPPTRPVRARNPSIAGEIRPRQVCVPTPALAKTAPPFP